MCLCARAEGWVEVGLIVLILSLPLFFCLLRFWDDYTDKQQTTDTEQVTDRLTNVPALTTTLGSFQKGHLLDASKHQTYKEQGTEQKSRPRSSNKRSDKQPECSRQTCATLTTLEDTTKRAVKYIFLIIMNVKLITGGIRRIIKGSVHQITIKP